MEIILELSMIENSNKLTEHNMLLKARRYLLIMILLSIWDLTSSIIFAIFVLHSDEAICLNNKVQKNIKAIWRFFAIMYYMPTVLFTIHRAALCIIVYRKDKSFKITNNKCFVYSIIGILYGIVLLWILLIVIAGICNNYSIYFYISIIYISIQFVKEIVFICIWRHS